MGESVTVRVARLVLLSAVLHVAFADAEPLYSDAGIEAADKARLSLPQDIRLTDLPNDNGTGLVITWEKDDAAHPATTYEILVSDSREGPWYPAVQQSPLAPLVADKPEVFGLFYPDGNRQYAVISFFSEPPVAPDALPLRRSIEPGEMYYAHFTATLGDRTVSTVEPLSAKAVGNWFRWNKLNNFIFAILFAAIILLFIELARRNPGMYIRKIAGLDAVEEALGRATEMGKPVYFVHGLEGMGHISTIAAVNVLGRVARRAFEYETSLKVMNRDPVVMAVSREVVHQSALEVGRPDAYNEDNVMFVASEQFSYAAAVDGLMVRERPATVLLMGYFFAESLLLAETGSHIGAIQIAGSDAYTQLPFFITTCDYTLMGEELYAASAYLSREPKLLGSLRGQDVGKAAILAVLVFGTLLEILGIGWLTKLVMPL